jgi:DNA-binding CsgD family transcriptional regulator/PAS domain-containing protein
MCPQAVLLDLIGEIYESALEPQLWPKVLERIASQVQGEATVLMAQDSLNLKSTVTHAVRVDSAVEREYNDYYGARNIWAIRGRHYLRSHRVFTSEMVCTKAEFEASEYYQDYLRRLKISHSIGGAFADGDGGDQLIFSVTGLTQRGPFEQPEVDLLQLLLPHFRRSLQLYWRIESLAGERDHLRDTLDRLPCGCILTGPSGKALYLNAAVEQILDANDGLALMRGVLTAAHPGESRRLRSILVAATATGLHRGAEPGRAISISRLSARRPYSVLAIPITSPDASTPKKRVAAAVFITDPDQAPPDMGRDLRDWFAFTKAEERLAMALLPGRGLKAAADELGISLNTAKTHLRNIFDKTNTRRQGELVRLLMTGPRTYRPIPGPSHAPGRRGY